MRKTVFKILSAFMVFGLIFAQAAPMAGYAQADAPQKQAPAAFAPVVFTSMKNDLSPALSDIAKSYDAGALAQKAVDLGFVMPKAQEAQGDGAFDTSILQANKPVANEMPAPFQSFDGVGNLFGGWPPDTEGDIGPNHYMQWINLHYAVWSIDKVNHTATLVLGPLPGNSLFTGFGGACESTNDGDPIVLYDPLADRWLASQFALPNFPNGPFYQCTAVSQTNDPTGAWYRYQYQWPTNKLNDYPKFGVWENSYFLTANQFNAGSFSWGGAGVVAFDKAAMLAGNPAQAVYFDLYPVNPNYGGMLPADYDGLNPIPTGAPGLFAEWDDSTWIPPNDAVRVWEFDVDWTNPGAATFGIGGNPNYTITTTNVDPDMCGFARNCIPQPGTSAKLDAISDRLMYRLQYRNMGGYQTLVTNHTVDAGGDHAAPHWLELRDTGAGWTLYQEGVYAPDATHRWMGSAAMDHVGNISVGYSASSTSVYPSVWYTGRLAGDPLGTLPQGEASIVNGTGSQTDMSYSRWGDYSMLGVDPVDDCTFWFTQEWVQTTGSNTWKTRIGEYKFPDCTIGATGTLQGTVTDASTSAPIGGATVTAVGPQTQSTTTNPDGTYSLTLLTGDYDVTASAFGYQSQTVTGVTIVDGTTTTQNFALTPSASTTVSGVVYDATTGWPLYASVAIAGVPGSPFWTDPVTGYYEVTLPDNASYDFTVNAWVPGYTPANVTVAVAGATTQDFPLDADLVACIAPGYNFQYDWFEDFEAGDGGFTVSGATTTWQWGAPTSGPGAAHSGANVWATNLAGSYLNSENGYITSPVIDLSGFAGATMVLNWYQWAQTESSFDFISVEASNNGGTTWNVVYGPLSGAIDTSWAKKTVVLPTSYAVANFQMRFHFTSDGSIVYPGWYIDDIGLSAQYPPPPTVVYDENFDATDGGYTHSGTADEWQWGVPTTAFPGGCYQGSAACWDTDLLGNYEPSSNYSLFSPVIDLSGVSLPPGSNLYLKWAQAIHIESATFDHANANVSINGGAFTNLWTNPVGTITQAWAERGPYDISTAAGGNIQLQYQLTSDSSVQYEGWTVDSVQVYYSEPWTPAATCAPAAGGLVVGNVYDANTNAALNGAKVENEGGYATTAMATPNDPNVDDAFYTVFSPAGIQQHTASISTPAGYQPDSTYVDVPLYYTTHQNFFLGAGLLDTTPDSLSATLNLGETETQQLELANLGSAALNFEIFEQDGGFVPGRPVGGGRSVVTIGDMKFSANAKATGESVTPAVPQRAPDAVTITHSLSQATISGNSVSCNAGGLHADNSYLRVFDLPSFGITGAFNITNVEVGIELATGAGGTQPTVMNLYTLNGPLLWANMTLIGTANFQVPDQALTIINVPVTGVAPPGSILVAEFFTPDGQTAGNSLFVGSNNLGQTAPTYLAAADCGVVEPTDTAAIGFPGMHLVMNVTGEVGGFDAVPWLSENPTSGTLSPGAAALLSALESSSPSKTVNASGLAAASEGVQSGEAPQPNSPEDVLWDQPSGNAAGVIDQYFPDFGAGVFTADDFVLTQPVAIDHIFVDGVIGNLANADAFYWIIYPDNGGVPAGYPGDGSGADVWAFAASTSSPAVTLAEAGTQITLDVIAATGGPLVLPAGTYWLSAFPSLAYLSYGQWFWDVATTSNGAIGQVIDPYDLLGAGWTDWSPITLIGATYHDTAFRLEGVPAAASAQTVDVTFDASMVTQPGDYFATLQIANDTPYGPVNVPVTMTVQAPASWGKLEGTVTSLGYCDANPTPAEGATVLITDSGGMTYTLTTDANGYYTQWFDEDLSPFEVNVTFPEHETGTATGVVVTAGGTTTQDFDLRWLKPCMSSDPTSLEVTVPFGYSMSEPLDLLNMGAAPSDFQVIEMPGGYTPLVLGNKPLPNKKKNPEYDLASYTHAIESPVAVGDELFRFDATAATGHVCILGVEFAMGNFWVTSGGETACTDGVDNYLFEIAPNGTVVNSWNQNTSSTFGWRDLAFDGAYLYASDSGVVVQIDPATGATTGVTIPAPTNPARALAYNPDTDHFFTANFSSSIYEFDRSGTVVHTFPNTLAVYGAAWDMYSDGGPYLWVWSQDGSPAVLATQIDPVTGNQTGVAFVGSSTDGTDIAGGATIINGDHPDFPGKLIFLGAHQAGNDMLVGYDMDVYLNFDVPWMSEDPVTGTVPADDMATIDVAFNETMTFTLGTYTATLRINTDDPVAPALFVPVTMHIVPPVFGVEAMLENDALSGAPGETLTYSVVVTNTGNAPDTFDVAVSGNAWVTTAPATVGPLAAGESTTVDFTVEIPASAADMATDEATLTFTSQTDATKFAEVTATTTAVIPYEFGVTLTPATDAKSGSPGAMVAYVLTLTNTGDITDTFDLAAVSTNGWTLALSGTEFTLGAGESVEVTVHVTIPASAASGASDLATVTATSQGDDSKFAVSELTTTAVFPKIYLPVIPQGYTP